MKFVLVDYVRFTCQIQDMTDMKEVWKLPYLYTNFRQINNNIKKKLHYFIHNFYNLFVTVLVFTET